MSRKVKAEKYNANNCIWGTWIFHEYFDALNTEHVGVPLIAVKYVSTSELTEDIPLGDNKTLTRRKVTVAIEFFDNDVGSRVAISFQAMMKVGTVVVDALHYESFLHPKLVYVVAMHTHINTYTVINTLHTDVRYRWMAVLQRSKCAWRSVDS